MSEKRKRSWLIFFAIAFIIFIIDISTKEIIERSIPYLSEIKINSFFNIVHVRNRGSVFGLFSDIESETFRVAFNILSVSIMVLIVVFSRYFEGLSFYTIGAMFGGAMGNVTERLLKGYVVDFLDFHVGKWHWPAFNLADTTISLGMIILLLQSLKKPEKKE